MELKYGYISDVAVYSTYSTSLSMVEIDTKIVAPNTFTPQNISYNNKLYSRDNAIITTLCLLVIYNKS